MTGEAFIRRFHAANAGITSRVLARGDSYRRLAARVSGVARGARVVDGGARGAVGGGSREAGDGGSREVGDGSREAVGDDRMRVLDIGCGDGHLLALLAARGCSAVGIDISAHEVARATIDMPEKVARASMENAHVDIISRTSYRSPVDLPHAIVGRAQELPFAAESFDACVSHLAFSVMDDVACVVAEIDRVLVPNGCFHAVVGGGPTATGRDAFHRFLELARPHGPRLGEERAVSEDGWRSLFVGWEIAFERWEIDLSGSVVDVWAFLASGYQGFDHAAEIRAELASEFGARLPCTVVVWLAEATRRSETSTRRG